MTKSFSILRRAIDGDPARHQRVLEQAFLMTIAVDREYDELWLYDDGLRHPHPQDWSDSRPEED